MSVGAGSRQFNDSQFFSLAVDEVLIIKSMTHRDFNAMIKVKILSQNAVAFLIAEQIVKWEDCTYKLTRSNAGLNGHIPEERGHAS